MNSPIFETIYDSMSKFERIREKAYNANLQSVWNENFSLYTNKISRSLRYYNILYYFLYPRIFRLVQKDVRISIFCYIDGSICKLKDSRGIDHPFSTYIRAYESPEDAVVRYLKNHFILGFNPRFSLNMVNSVPISETLTIFPNFYVEKSVFNFELYIPEIIFFPSGIEGNISFEFQIGNGSNFYSWEKFSPKIHP